MTVLLSLILIAASPVYSPQEICDEIRIELYDAAREGYITYKEADKILKDCLKSTWAAD